jgi:triosephosphate isomerase
MRQLIAGNWKMNGLRAEAIALATALRQGCDGLGCDLLICPPATVLHAVGEVLAGSPVALGGQDCHAEPRGAHTGDIAAPMLRDAGAGWVILGHSERRADHHETDDLVRAKVLAATEAGLTPIVCVGEREDQRTAGQETEVVGWQLSGSLPKGFTGAVAYEPVWAIGTGRNATPEQAQEVHAFIRARIAAQDATIAAGTRILYGGSVKASNAAVLFAMPDVDGGLIGGASLKADEFIAILAAAGSR